MVCPKHLCGVLVRVFLVEGLRGLCLQPLLATNTCELFCNKYKYKYSFVFVSTDAFR